TVHAIPAAAHARANPYPVGPASYATRTGAASPANHAVTSSTATGTRNVRSSPLTPSSTPATVLRACTSRPTHVPSAIPPPPLTAALPPAPSRRHPAPTYERGAGPPIRSSRICSQRLVALHRCGISWRLATVG